MSAGKGAANDMRTLGRLRRFLWDRRGTSAVEFGLAAPILIVATLGTVDFGRAMWTSTTLKQVASEAGRYAAIRGAEKPSPATESDVVNYAKTKAAGLNADELIVTVTWSPNNTSGSRVTVTVSYDFDFVLVGFLPLDPIRIEHASIMTVG